MLGNTTVHVVVNTQKSVNLSDALTSLVTMHIVRSKAFEAKPVLC